MMTNKPRLRKLHYQITPEDYLALRACLSARAEEQETRSVHTMFFTSYRDRVPVDAVGSSWLRSMRKRSFHFIIMMTILPI